MTSMIKADGNLLAFIERPISATLGALVLLIALFQERGAFRQIGEFPRGGESGTGLFVE